jgi:hypothetical protein
VAGSANHSVLYPLPSDVRLGVTYGPGGIYTGTYSPSGSGYNVFVVSE